MLAREIYGGEPWLMDARSFIQYSNLLIDLRNGVSFEEKETKNNSLSLLKITNQTKLISRTWQLNNKESFDGIGVINLNGPITKNGGASSYGTLELSNMMLEMAQDERIKGFIIRADSGGGSSSAVELMTDTISEVKKKKPVYSLIEKGGMAASAAYGIISSSTKIYAQDKMSIVGSVGTMISFSGFPANKKDKSGMKHITVYATKSTQKNKAFEEAVNNDNYDLLINELLDPINENFINLVKGFRPQLTNTEFDNGHTVFTKDAVGTFIDGFSTFDEVVNEILNINNNFNFNNNPMTSQELQSNHPEVYNEILNLGITQERERVGVWMAHLNTDQKSVIEGVNSGNKLTDSQREKFIVKASMLKNVDEMEENSPKQGITDESVNNLDEENKREAEEAFNFKL